MSNVYISFLGTNDYLECTYQYEDADPVKNIRFVQEATLKTFCSEWTPDDRIFIFTTGEACKKNWLDNGHIDRETKGPLPRTGLENRIRGLGLAACIEKIDIPEGKSKDEIWQIFNNVYDRLNPGDEVVFDITHSFRSIPMLAIVVLNYAKVIKKISLKGVYYGAFEVLGPLEVAKNIPPEKRLVPILNLTPFDLLMEWSFAIDRFLGSGDAGPVSDLAMGSVAQILNDTKGRDETAKAIRSLGKGLVSFSKVLATCRGPQISKVSRNLTKQINKCDKLSLPPAFLPLFNLLKEEIAHFKGSDIDDGIQAARWCLDHNLIQQAYTILQETLFSHMLLSTQGDMNDLIGRDIASQAIKIHMEELSEDEWHFPAEANKETTRKFLEFLRTTPGLVKAMRDLTQFRNDLNHAGYGPSPMKPHKFAAKLEPLLCNIIGVLKE